MERLLYRFVCRLKVPLYMMDAGGTTWIATEQDMFDPTFTLKIPQSSALARGEANFAQIDGIDLVKALEGEDTSWPGDLRKHDWLLVERIVRDIIAQSGFTVSDQEMMRRCRERYVDLTGAEDDLTQSDFSDLARSLRKEHESSV